MLTEKQMKEIKEELLNSNNPLFLFHDDADGLCSFLQFYKQIYKGKGVMVKSTPKVDSRFLKVVESYNPDKIFVLDLAMIDQEFVNAVNKKIIWIDHHEIADIKGVQYYNPKLNENENKKFSNSCISKISYEIFKQNFWISAVGTIGDWQLPKETREKILKEMPDLFDEKITDPEKALFETKLGKLAKIFNFTLKGKSSEANSAVKVLTRIEDPREILEEKTPQGKFIMKRFNKVNKEYEALLNKALKKANEHQKLFVFTYEGNKLSLSGELSNELLYRFPEKIIIIARHHNKEMKTSFRSAKKIKVRSIIEKAIQGIDGRFGGHEYACGGIIKDKDWNKFIENIKQILDKENQL